MKISTKGRYALAATIIMAQRYKNTKYIALANIADELGLSKVYMEHVFSLLRKEKVVFAVKGAGGGYQLTNPPAQITVFEVLSATENVFEPTEETVAQTAKTIESTMQNHVFNCLDEKIYDTLQQITLEDLIYKLETEQVKDLLCV